MSLASDRELARGIATVALFAALASVARLAQDIAIAWRHGTGPAVDAYTLLCGLAQWPVLVALSVLTALVGPAEAALPAQAGPSAAAERMRFRAELLGAAMLVALLAWPLAHGLLGVVAGSGRVGLSPAAAQEAARGVAAAAAIVPLGLVGALFAAWLVADGRHLLTLVEAIPALVLVGALAVLAGPVLIPATAAGIGLQTLACALLLGGWTALRPRLGRSSPGWAGLGRGALLLLATQALFGLAPLVDTFIALRLGEGEASAVGFASRLLLGLLGLGGLALQRAGLPLLTALAVADAAASRRVARRWALLAAAGGLALAAVVALLADPLVALLYERGRFGSVDRAAVVDLLRAGLLQLPMYFGGIVVVTALASARATGALAGIAAAGVVVKLIASVALAPMLGSTALPLATALMYVATAGLAWLAWSRMPRGAR